MKRVDDQDLLPIGARFDYDRAERAEAELRARETKWREDCNALIERAANAEAGFIEAHLRTRESMIQLLDAVAIEARPCRKCGGKIWLVRLRTKRLAVLNADGASHYDTCAEFTPAEEAEP